MSQNVVSLALSAEQLTEVKKALDVERHMQTFIKDKYAGLVDRVEATKELDADAEKALSKAIEEFKATLA